MSLDSKQQLDGGPSRSQRVLSPILRVSLLLGVAVHLVGFLIFKVSSNPLPTRQDSSAYIEYVSDDFLNEDVELKEQAMLFDSAPLFIPTQWNVAAQTYETHLSAGNWTFPHIDPQIDLRAELKPSVGLIMDVDELNEPMDLLASPHWSFFDGFVGEARVVEPLPDPEPFALVRVVAVSQVGAPVLQTIRVAGLAYEGQLARAPVSYWLRISPELAFASQPLLNKSSGSRLFDESVLTWLKLPSTLARLPNGYLLITVYPE